MSAANYRKYEKMVRRSLEERIRREYGEIPFTVLHNHKVKGQSGHKHQIDIYIEIPFAGVKVVILGECKSYRRSISTADVLTLWGRLDDIKAVKGIIFTTIGCQEGAVVLAESKGIALIVTPFNKTDSWDIVLPTLLPPLSADVLLKQSAHPDSVNTNERVSSSQAGNSVSDRSSFSPKKVKILHRLKWAVATLIGLPIVTTVGWWFFLDQPVRLAVSIQPARALSYLSLQILGQSGRTRTAAKIARIIEWQRQDVQDDPLRILDMLDRCKIGLTNGAGLGTITHFVFPATNHYAFLTNLKRPSDGEKLEYGLTESVDDPILGELLRDAASLETDCQMISRLHGEVDYACEYRCQFAIMLADAGRLIGGFVDDRAKPTPDEFFTFTTNSARALNVSESVHILGGIRTNNGWLYLCEMTVPHSVLPIQVLFHSRWKPKVPWIVDLETKTIKRINPDDWETGYSVILPPSAWDEERVWKAIK